MLAQELYDRQYFLEGRYAAKFSNYVTQEYVDGSTFIQAQRFSPLAKPIGDGSLGHKFEVVESAGGLSSRRDFFEDVDARVAPTASKMIELGLNSELLKADNMQEIAIGSRESERQTKAAIDRLRLTTAFLIFNADTTKINITDRKTGAKLYNYDGMAKFMKSYPRQSTEVLNVGDLASNVNMRFQANFYLDGVNHKVNVNGANADIIYTTSRGAVLLSSLESDRQAYLGEYKFSRNVQTWQGIPVITIPDEAVPTSWTTNGNIPVLFVNQDENAGSSLMIPENAGLITIGKKVPTSFGYTIGMDLMFAPVLVNSKCAALGFLNERSGGSGISVEAGNDGVMIYEVANGVFRIDGDNIIGGVATEYLEDFGMGVGGENAAVKGAYVAINLKSFLKDSAVSTIVQTNPALELFDGDSDISNSTGSWVKTKSYDRTGVNAGADLDYTFLVKNGSSIITITDGTKSVRFECSLKFRA